MLAVLMLRSGMSWLMIVDLPTPLLPERSVTLSCSSALSVLMPCLVCAEMLMHL